MSLDDIIVENGKKNDISNEINEIIDDFKNKKINDFSLGVIAGEGSFTIPVQKETSYRFGYRICTKLSISAHKNNKSMLDVVMNDIGLGNNIYINSADQYHYDIASINGCKKLVMIINNTVNNEHPFTQTTKYKNFLIWEKAVNILWNKDRYNKKIFNEVLDLRDRINEGHQKHRIKIERP